MSLILGVTGSLLFLNSESEYKILGALIFLISYIFDNCDGEVARFKNLTSNFGKSFDTFVDWVVHTVFFIMLGYGTAQETGNNIWLWLGVTGSIGGTINYLIVTFLKPQDDINKREKNRRYNDPLYKIKLNLRSRIRKTIINKKGKTTDILGCGYDEVRDYISNKFKEGMSWDNYGEWHIDHIKPLALANTEKETYELCHYTNLQPLWAIENLQKGCNNLI